jgi:elongation factor G
MSKTGPGNIRNIVLLSHSGAGKTSLSEAALLTAGAIGRLGRVDDGSTTSDYDPDEIKRKISISLSLLPCEWRDSKVNIIDTPGYADFAGEVRAAIRVCEGAVLLVSAAAGVKVGTEQSWSCCVENRLPRFIMVNKMDRENASFSKTVLELREKFGSMCLPIQIPIGAHDDFEGIIDLIEMKAYIGSPAKESEIPDSLKGEADNWREKLIEAAAEVDDNLIEKYLGGEELTIEELKSGLKRAVKEAKVVPVLAGSALKNIGADLLLTAATDYLPSPADVMVPADGGEIKADEKESLATLVFKTTADPYVGKLTYFRVYGGIIKSNTHIWNVSRGVAERIGQLSILRGKNQEPVAQVGAGDIGAVAKMGETATGDTLGEQNKPLKLKEIKFQEPIFEEAVHPKSKADLDKLGTALSRLTEEDPTLKMRREADTGETILVGLGETQLEVVAERMARKFGVNIELKTPKVPYKETVTIPSKAEYKHKKQSGGHGQYGHVRLEIQPLPRGSGLEFENKIVGGSIPRNYIPSVEKGVNETAQEGVLVGSKVVDVKVILYDGSFHPVDSSDICFKIAGAQALKKGLSQGQPILLEPIMNLKVTVPNDTTGDIISDLNTKRAQVQGMNPDGDMNIIEAQAPLAEIQRYAIDLKSLTQGRGSYQMSFSRYSEVPAHISQKLIAEKQAEKQDK